MINKEWSRTTLNSIDSISSMNSPLFAKKNQSKRNLPKYHESKLTDSSSEESIASSPNNISSSPEDSVDQPQCPVVFMCDPEDKSCTNAISVKIECQSLNKSIEEIEKSEVVTNPVPEKL